MTTQDPEAPHLRSPRLCASGAPIDGASSHRPNLQDSEHASPAIPQDVPDELVDEVLDPATKHHEGDPGCWGSKGYVYPFKVKLEERYPTKDPASYTEFERRYPPDRFGEETSDDARVWKLYRDRVTERDEDQIEGWNKTLDILLIFAGLFSAVATAFIIEAYKQLQPDYSEILAKAFIASLNGTAGAELASFNHFSRPALARSVNTLWFLSLTLALIVALLAILAKQWLGEYTSRMRRHIGSQRRWAWRHLAYYSGLERWGMDAFISTLPLMLHISLLLFLVGLVAFLTDLDWVIVGFVLPLTATVMVFYICAIAAPLWFGDCPTATPILRQGRRALEVLHNQNRRCLFFLRSSIGARFKLPFGPTSWRPPAYDEEVLLEGGSARRDATVLHWMINSLPTVEEIDVALDAVGSVDPLEHRHEFHSTPTGADQSAPVKGDILCLGHVSVAAVARFVRLCEGAASSDAIAVARCIRTLLSLSIDRLRALQLPPSQTIAAHISLLRWAAIPSHDLPLLCNNFLAWDNSQCIDIRDAVLAWQDDAGPGTGETPYLPSSIALSFLRCDPYTPETTAAMAVIYSALSGPFASSLLEPAQRRAASTILHNAAFAAIQGWSDGKSIEPCSAMHTPEQLHFRAISTVGALWRFSSGHASEETCRILATRFAHLISISPRAETLTLEHLPYARDILDIVPWLGPDDVQVAPKVFELIEHYLRRLENWSADVGEMTRRLIELYTDPNSSLREVYLATYLAFRLSNSHRNTLLSSEVSVCHSLVNLLLPGAKGEQSVWRMLCNTEPRGIQADYIITLAGLLAPYLTSLKRRGLDDANLVEEFLGDDRLYNIMYAASFDWSMAHLAQHARELSHSWWESTKARLPSFANSGGIEHAGMTISSIPGLLTAVAKDGPISALSQLADLIQEVDTFGDCVICDVFQFEGTGQDGFGGQSNAESSLMAQTFRQARLVISKMTQRGTTIFASSTRDHELPVIALQPATHRAS